MIYARVYDPGEISTMGRAFDNAVKDLSQQAKADPNIRRNIARCIIRLFDEGERAPLHLSIIALSIVVGDGPKPANKQPHSTVLANWCPDPLGH